jgi:dolichol kinase
MTSENKKKITPFSFMGSIIAAWFGVQSKSNRDRDFEQGKFHHFVIGGIIFAVLFVLAVVGLVKVVMHFAGV